MVRSVQRNFYRFYTNVVRADVVSIFSEKKNRFVNRLSVDFIRFQRVSCHNGAENLML